MKFKIGERIYSKEDEVGYCHDINEKNTEYLYNFHFDNGVKAWVSKSMAEKEITISEKNSL